ncbi:MAG: Tho complex subunit 7-domain-containing protein [Linnemannia gamsii]|nr:MAG: Tho complex subunit 7-domain-containing protein [Linnemannia gamsii]
MEHDDTDSVIRTRLSVNERPLRRLTQRFQKWTGVLVTGSKEDIENGLQGLLMEISQFELGLSKSTLVAEMAERERQHYHEERHQIEDNIALSQEELETLAHDLEEAKQERTNKIEYDQLAAQVLQFPSRESNQQSIAQLNAEILELENEAVLQSQLMDLRKKQFFTALLCLQSTQESIREDRREEEKRMYLKRSHMDDPLEDNDEDDEGGFIENMDGVEALDGERAAGGTGTPQLAPALERVYSQDGHVASPQANRSRRGSASPGRPEGHDETEAEEGGVDGEVFMLDLHPNNTHRGGGGTPGRSNYLATPTPPIRSLTGTPNPADTAMDTFP